MAPIEVAILIALVVAAVFFIYAAAFTSWQVAKSPYFEPGQKYAQYAVIWLLPIIGVAIMLHILSPDVRRRRPGWVPWLEFLLVAAFTSSATAAIDGAAAQHSGANDGSSTPDGGGDD